MTMMNRISDVIGQLIWAGSAFVGYLRSASAFFQLPSFQPFTSVGPIFTITLSLAPAGRSVDVKDRPDFVRKSFARSQSENLDHGPTKMWKLQSLAWTVITLFFANVSSAGFT